MYGHRCYLTRCNEHGVKLSECHCKGPKSSRMVPCPCRLAHDVAVRNGSIKTLDPLAYGEPFTYVLPEDHTKGNR